MREHYDPRDKKGAAWVGQGQVCRIEATVARRAFAPKRSLKDQVADNQRIAAFYAKDGKAPDLPHSPQYLGEPKRKITHKSDKEELEGSVLKEVGEIILLAPSVLIAWRQNGGAAQAADGVFRIWFYRWIKRPVDKMVLVDFLGILKYPLGRMLAIECKRRHWHYTGTEREVKQKAFIDSVIASGGRGGFVTSAEQALALLK